MVEGELWQTVRGEPARVPRVVGTADGVLPVHGGEVDDRHRPPSGISARRVIDTEQLQRAHLKAGLLGQLPWRGVEDPLALLDEAARERPLAGEGRVCTLHEKQAGNRDLGQHDDIHRQHRPRR